MKGSPLTEKFTMVGSVAVHYADSLSGEGALLLLHGYLESLDVWSGFAPMLSGAGYRVVALDIPGHGISEVTGEVHTMEMMAEVAAGLMDKLEIGKFSVIGHSMGGYVALAMAKKYGERLDSLILFSSTPNADDQEKIENRRREIEIVNSGRKELLSGVVPGKGFAPDNRKRMAEEIADLSLQVMLTEDEGIVALLRGMMQREDMNGMLRGLKIPQLFIFGRRDEYIPEDAAEAAAANNPQAAAAWLDESGHNGFLEQPGESLRIITEFLKGIKTGGDADEG